MDVINISFIGKFAAVGQGGAGKTRAIAQVTNHLLGKGKYPWDEEANLSGTSMVMPYSLSLPSGVKIIIADNPGQNSLEQVRLSVAKAGADYKGVLIFTDATAWNFREVGILHAESIAQYVQQKDLPVAFITNKADIIQKFQQTDLLHQICDILANTVSSSTHGQEVPYFERVQNKYLTFSLNIINDWIPFTQLEQLLINALVKHIYPLKIPGITKMNIRLLVRALLLGYCDYYRDQYTEFIKQYPVFNAIDENLINSLNYHRPSAFETDTPWKVLTAQSRSKIIDKNEPPFQRAAMSAAGIDYVFKNYCLGTLSKQIELEGKIRQRALKRGWKFTTSAYSDAITIEGQQKIINCIEKLAQASLSYDNRLEKKDTLELNKDF